MKEKILNLVGTNKFGMPFCVLTGAIISSAAYAIGRSIGNIEGMDYSNNLWKAAIEKIRDESQEEE